MNARNSSDLSPAVTSSAQERVLEAPDQYTTILCVTNGPEPEPALRRALADYNLVFAANGFEALRALNARAFEAYVLDYWFPDWNGVGLCRKIRAIDPHVPVVFYSTSSSPTEKGRALRAGASAYLVRPLDPAVLRARLAGLLARAASESLAAQIEERRAIQEELERHRRLAQERVIAAKQLAASSAQRTARSKAMRAFFVARGTQAHFDRWWPEVFSSQQAKEPR